MFQMHPKVSVIDAVSKGQTSSKFASLHGQSVIDTESFSYPGCMLHSQVGAIGM